MTDGYTVVSQAGQGVPQDLGVLFPDELQAGVTVIRGPEPGTSPASATTEDDYVIQLLQSQDYSFTLERRRSAGRSSGDGDGMPRVRRSHCSLSSDGQVFFAPLVAGTYTVAVGGWTAGQSASVSYQLTIDLVGQQDDAPPLVDGPAPLLQIHLDGIGPSPQRHGARLGPGWLGSELAPAGAGAAGFPRYPCRGSPI